MDNLNSGYVFNPVSWKKMNLTNLTTEQVTALDNRYINLGENVPYQSVDNMNLINLNIATTGKIYFSNDNTEQTTAYDPNDITKSMNNLLTRNNIFTGENKFTNLNIIDSTNNTKKTQITQTDGTLTIENKIPGQIKFNTYYNADIMQTLSYDGAAVLKGISDLIANVVKTTQLSLDGTIAIYAPDHNFTIQNYRIGNSINFTTTYGTSLTNTLTYNPLGDLSGINNLSVQSLNFKDSNVIIKNVGSQLLIDNNTISSSFVLQNYDSSNISRSLTIDESLNVFGIKNYI